MSKRKIYKIKSQTVRTTRGAGNYTIRSITIPEEIANKFDPTIEFFAEINPRGQIVLTPAELNTERVVKKLHKVS